MTIERTDTDFVVRLSMASPLEQLQDMLDYLRYKELTASYSIPQSEVDSLAREINKEWWNANSHKYAVKSAQ